MTNAEAARRFIDKMSERIEFHIGHLNINTGIISPENPNHVVDINGKITAQITKDPGNYIEGFGCEWHPHDYISGWEFDGEIIVFGEDSEIIEEITITN